ncbi:bifunctional transcriptional activator/DNA repair enzyme AdaA [Paenibacillus silviterrae]|uniref:bifunctional transcriptional activator/DNA repair enzyme AdaA n=1 Tax=Paenibacillus silviterrae TaxID=3242194 RepID=UPI002543928F|nr:bifunctional transcriptional activator/DNA repair enzyme AdaA [Paenibacillus chinjuensis]
MKIRMKNHEAPVSEKQWRAIIDCDSSYDGLFIYAVLTTGIFCKPSCRSRVPNRGNVTVFGHAEEALTAGFRPCKRCKPMDRLGPMEDWVDRITQYIDDHYKDPLTLEALSYHCHGSPYHLQRTFKRWKGMTPGEYIQQTRIHKAKELLAGSDKPVAEIGSAVGLPSAPYFITLFKRKTGHTPADFRKLLREKTR